MMDFLSRVEAWKNATLNPERTSDFLRSEPVAPQADEKDPDTEKE